jgi:hypothetical protein
MKQLLPMLVLVNVLGLVPAGADDTIELALLQASPRMTSILSGHDQVDRTLIREDECSAPETVALIESNREDVERTTVMDR